MVGEGVVWMLFFALLVPAGFVGWVIGHSTARGTQTVTRTVALSASVASATQTTPVPTATVPASAAASAAKEKAVFVANACGSCHTFKPAGASGTIGPDLDTKPAIDAKKAHMPLAAFVRQSIVKPNAYISPGYPKGVMPQSFGAQLSKAQLADLVRFITGGK